jgi:hypothetical protein
VTRALHELELAQQAGPLEEEMAERARYAAGRMFWFEQLHSTRPEPLWEVRAVLVRYVPRESSRIGPSCIRGSRSDRSCSRSE